MLIPFIGPPLFSGFPPGFEFELVEFEVFEAGGDCCNVPCDPEGDVVIGCVGDGVGDGAGAGGLAGAVFVAPKSVP
jgi:hypothetical protein